MAEEYEYKYGKVVGAKKRTWEQANINIEPYFRKYYSDVLDLPSYKKILDVLSKEAHGIVGRLRSEFKGLTHEEAFDCFVQSIYYIVTPTFDPDRAKKFDATGFQYNKARLFVLDMYKKEKRDLQQSLDDYDGDVVDYEAPEEVVQDDLFFGLEE